MKKYPKLKTLKINGGRGRLVYDPGNYVGSMISTQDKFSVSVIAKFMFSVGGISNHDIKRLYTSASIADILQMYWRLCGPSFIKTLALECSIYDCLPVQEPDIPIANICLYSAAGFYPKDPYPFWLGSFTS